MFQGKKLHTLQGICITLKNTYTVNYLTFAEPVFTLFIKLSLFSKELTQLSKLYLKFNISLQGELFVAERSTR